MILPTSFCSDVTSLASSSTTSGGVGNDNMNNNNNATSGFGGSGEQVTPPPTTTTTTTRTSETLNGTPPTSFTSLRTLSLPPLPSPLGLDFDVGPHTSSTEAAMRLLNLAIEIVESDNDDDDVLQFEVLFPPTN